MIEPTANKKLYIRLLGTVSIEGLGRVAIPIIGSHTAALLAYLAFYCDRSHTRDELATLFWPEEDQDTARQRLRQTLYN